MVTARILEKWTVELPEPVPGNPYFLDWMLRSPRQSGLHLTAGWHALRALQNQVPLGHIDSAIEFFGGIGAQALMVQDLFSPEDHVVFEISPDAVEHISGLLPDAWVSQRDAYHPETGGSADLVVLDFGDLTAWKTRDKEPHRQLLDRVFERHFKGVVITDVAARYLHLHRERYESLLGAGTCATYETYLEALARRFQALYGVRLVAGYVDRWSTVMSFVPDDGQWGTWQPTPTSPRGLEIL